jgi:peptide/nickel transport system substrate-binding protein
MRTRTTALLAAVCLAASRPACAAPKNPDTFVELAGGDPESLDPAWASDTAGQSVLLNVYETLFQFDGSSLRKLIPLLAERVPSVENGLISSDGLTYRIPIRKNVTFHDGAPMTVEDVRYSFLRAMLMDRPGGPSALLLEPLLGYASTRAAGRLRPEVWQDANRAVSADGGDVVLRLPRPCPYLLSILASRSPMIVSRKWAAANGAWDGTESSWARFNNPAKESSPFFRRADGTGPFVLARWDAAERQLVLARNDRYWRAPARLKTVFIRTPPAFLTAKLMLAAGDADNIAAEFSEESQLKGLPGVSLVDSAPDVGRGFDIFFTYKTAAGGGNPFIGSGRLDGEGVPPDFFSDKEVRRGFAAAFDYDAFMRDMIGRHGSRAHGCVPKGLLGYDASGPVYTRDLKEAQARLRRAFGGRVWSQGFRLTIGTTDDPARIGAARILKKNVESLNPKFKIEVRSLDWPEFADAYNSSKLPVFVAGFSGKYPDPNSFAFSYLDSNGVFPLSQKFSDPAFDRLVRRAGLEPDPAARQRLYERLQSMEYEEAPHIGLVDVTRFRAQRDWVRGWVDNPMYPGAPSSSYFYPIWKE